ncbi:hypothetical protein ACVWYN_003448 [Pedobacter sp. UYP24]
MNALTYLIQVNLYLVLFYGIYHLILRNETFFKMNRFYLVDSVLLSLGIPLLRMEWIKDLFITEKIYQATQTLSDNLNNVVIENPVLINNSIYSSSSIENIKDTTPALTTHQVFWIIYLSITIVLFLNFLRKLYLVNRALKGDMQNQAFSFFNKVVVDEQLKGKETIIDHEMVHVKQWHSLDVIFFELFAVFNWLNPISYAYKKAIKNIHEFIADETAASTLNDKTEYAMLLVSNAFGTQPQKLTNSFYNDSLLKRRIIMLNKNKSRKTAMLKYGLSVPLFALMVIFSSASIEKSATAEMIAGKIVENMPTLVHAITDDAVTEDPAANRLAPAKKLLAAPDQKMSTKKPETNVIEDSNDAELGKVVDYFKRSTKFPVVVQESKIVGNTYISFNLDGNGFLKNPVIIKAMNSIIADELMRVMENAQPFGTGVSGKYLLPIKFSLNIGDKDAYMPFDYAKDTIDFAKYMGYQKLSDITIIGYIRKSTSPPLAEIVTEMSAGTKTDGVRPLINVRTYVKNSPTDKMLEHLGKFQAKSTFPKTPYGKTDLKERIVKIAFDVSVDKKPGNYRIIDSDKTSWGNELVAHFNLFTDTVGLAPGSYYFYKKTGYGPVDREEKKITSPKGFKFAFGSSENGTITYTSTEEKEGDVMKIYNYILIPYLKKPVILVDGKVAIYKTTKKGFKLSETIYPQQADIKVYKGNKAVENYNESARKTGLVVITTKQL